MRPRIIFDVCGLGYFLEKASKVFRSGSPMYMVNVSPMFLTSLFVRCLASRMTYKKRWVLQIFNINYLHQIVCKFVYFVFAQMCGQVCVHVDMCVEKKIGG